MVMGNFTTGAALWGVFPFASRANLTVIHFNKQPSPDETGRADVISGNQLTRRHEHLM